MGKLQPCRLLWNLIVIRTIPNFMCQTTMFYISVSSDKTSSWVVIPSRNYFDKFHFYRGCLRLKSRVVQVKRRIFFGHIVIHDLIIALV